MYPTYVCVTCNFVAHNDCMYFSRVIKISRHRHRISYKSSLRSGEWLCGVCRKNIEIEYGTYSCDKCCDYVVHSICALGKDVCDGEDLEGVPEEYDITVGVESFDVISEGVILHFFHDHHLYFQVIFILVSSVALSSMKHAQNLAANYNMRYILIHLR
ncbi:Cysteine/Histidine-rich C1 domain family protein [Raphanus sativus]|nr:Cysteine/Histidine-rich C1 domain family protein [Raphanus sativus]